MNFNRISDLYFTWLCDLVYSDTVVSYRKLFEKLYNTEFIYIINGDEARARDGVNLRYRFGSEHGFTHDEIKNNLDIFPPSIFEVLISLAVRCEEDIMGDSMFGDRTGLWFWNMLVNIGLGEYHDENYNENSINFYIKKFLYRNYNKDGKGCAFRCNNLSDLSSVDLWYQMQYSLPDGGVLA